MNGSVMFQSFCGLDRNLFQINYLHKVWRRNKARELSLKWIEVNFQQFRLSLISIQTIFCSPFHSSLANYALFSYIFSYTFFRIAFKMLKGSLQKCKLFCHFLLSHHISSVTTYKLLTIQFNQSKFNFTNFFLIS